MSKNTKESLCTRSSGAIIHLEPSSPFPGQWELTVKGQVIGKKDVIQITEFLNAIVNK